MEQNDFPWKYPTLFTNILIQTDFKTILTARHACKSWKDWFNKNNIWVKYLNLRKNVFLINNDELTELDASEKMTKYRLNRLLLNKTGFPHNKFTEEEAFVISRKMYKILRQNELNLAFEVDSKCYSNVVTCLKEGIKSFGPVAAFIRIKVKNDLVATILDELINKYLSAIMVDKNEKDNKKLNDIIMSSLVFGQSWIREYFEPEDNNSCQVLKEGPEAVVYSSEAEMLADEAAKAAAAEAKTAAKGLKRGAEEDDDNEPSSKKARTSKKGEKKEEKTIYNSSEPTPVNPYFPTILELLDIDNPVLKRWLITKFGIDKILVIPRLGQILLQQSKSFENLNIPEDFEAIGRDCDGLVSKLKPSVDVKVTDLATVSFIDNVKPYMYGVRTDQIMFWGGSDIRERWSIFADQLSQPETQNMVVKKLGKKSNGLPSVYINVQADMLQESLPGLQEMLAANGVSLQQI